MHPTINEGDFIIYRPYKPSTDCIEEGYLVVLKHPLKQKTLIIKRVFSICDLGIELRGDNEANSNDSRQFGLINKSQILGIIDQVIPINQMVLNQKR